MSLLQMVPFFKLALQQIKHEKYDVWYVTGIVWCETEHKRHSKQQLKLQTMYILWFTVISYK
jgi:hypothetical protein